LSSTSAGKLVEKSSRVPLSALQSALNALSLASLSSSSGSVPRISLHEIVSSSTFAGTFLNTSLASWEIRLWLGEAGRELEEPQ